MYFGVREGWGDVQRYSRAVLCSRGLPCRLVVSRCGPGDTTSRAVLIAGLARRVSAQDLLLAAARRSSQVAELCRKSVKRA